jgi:hypothetical protein
MTCPHLIDLPLPVQIHDATHSRATAPDGR